MLLNVITLIIVLIIIVHCTLLFCICFVFLRWTLSVITLSCICCFSPQLQLCDAIQNKKVGKPYNTAGARHVNFPRQPVAVLNLIILTPHSEQQATSNEEDTNENLANASHMPSDVEEEEQEKHDWGRFASRD